MSSAVRSAPSPTSPAAGAPLGGPRAALVPWVAARRRRRLRALAPGELALTATLLSLYVGFRGSARVVGAIESIVAR
jgi:hypothetical protein